jgi:hypothetical protein
MAHPESPLAPGHSSRRGRFASAPTFIGTAKYAHIVRLSSPYHNILYHVANLHLIGWIPKLDGRFAEPNGWTVFRAGGHFHINVFENVPGRDALGAVGALDQVIAGLAGVDMAGVVPDHHRFLELESAYQETSAKEFPIAHGITSTGMCSAAELERTRVAEPTSECECKRRPGSGQSPKNGASCGL